MNTIEFLLNKIRKSGFRLTIIREAILNFLSSVKKPCSQNDIRENLLKVGVNANKTTIYRELEFLKKNKIIEEFNFNDGIKRYEISLNHHHHIICLKCKSVKCIELSDDLNKQEEEIKKNNKFKIINHSLEFYGLCRKCQPNLK